MSLTNPKYIEYIEYILDLRSNYLYVILDKFTVLKVATSAGECEYASKASKIR